jgi:pimeloyl-ACP methyl ester carboxylesterase
MKWRFGTTGLLAPCVLASGCLVFTQAPAQDAGAARHDRLVERAGVRIQYYLEGKGPLLVILPSLGRGAEDYDGFAALMASAGYRVLRPEPRGFGMSTGLMKLADLHPLAADVAMVIKDAGGEHASAFVMGHAFGSFVARQLAADRPDLVRALILAAGSAGKTALGTDGSPGGGQATIDIAANPDLPQGERLVALQAAFFAPGNDPHVWLSGWNRAVYEMEKGPMASRIDDWFNSGTAPILNIQADDDAIARLETMTVLQQYLGADRVTNVRIPHAGHALFPEQPTLVRDAMVPYLKAH